MDMQQNDRLTMTIPEYAALHGISRGLAYELAKQNALPVRVLRFGRRLLVSRAEVERVLNGDSNIETCNHNLGQ